MIKQYLKSYCSYEPNFDIKKFELSTVPFISYVTVGNVV